MMGRNVLPVDNGQTFIGAVCNASGSFILAILFGQLAVLVMELQARNMTR